MKYTNRLLPLIGGFYLVGLTGNRTNKVSRMVSVSFSNAWAQCRFSSVKCHALKIFMDVAEPTFPWGLSPTRLPTWILLGHQGNMAFPVLQGKLTRCYQFCESMWWPQNVKIVRSLWPTAQQMATELMSPRSKAVRVCASVCWSCLLKEKNAFMRSSSTRQMSEAASICCSKDPRSGQRSRGSDYSSPWAGI